MTTGDAMTREEQIEALRSRVSAAQQRADAANRELHSARADLEEAEGDTFNATWSRAVAAGDTETAHRCWIKSEARRAIEGLKPLHGLHEAAEVAAEVERLKAEAGHA